MDRPSIYHLECDWQDSDSSKNGSSSGFFGGAASLMEQKPFWKLFDKIAPLSCLIYIEKVK